MAKTSKLKQDVIAYMNRVAPQRDKWIKRNRYYYKDLLRFLKYNFFKGSSVLEIGCGTGFLLNALNPGKGIGIDIASQMIHIARKKYEHLQFLLMDGEDIHLHETFDFIIISDTVGYFEDIQKVFQQLKPLCHKDTRIIITTQSFFWNPFLRIAEILASKMPSRRLNWLNIHDIANLCHVEGFEVIKSGRRFLFPVFFPLISWLLNRIIVHLPLFNRLGMISYIIARQLPIDPNKEGKNKVSVIVPARNEEKNILNVVKGIPLMNGEPEIIFVEGHSTDGTRLEIEKVCQQFSNKKDIKFTTQNGIGKADAVRKGFELAKGDILMILDADLTVPPQELVKFYEAVRSGKGEFINGCRLVYPMEKQAMRMLNILGNKLFSMMFSWLLGQKIKDTLCGTKVLSKQNYEKIKENREFFGDFDPFGDFDLLFGSAKLNLKMVEIPIRYRAREYGDTNISRFRHGLLLLKMVLFALNKIKFI